MGIMAGLIQALPMACVLLGMLAADVPAMVWIDITAAPRKLPIALMRLSGPYGAQLTEIVADDLSYSGFFEPLDPEGFIEGPSEPFDRANWSGTGADAVLKGEVKTEDRLKVSITLYDVFEGKAILEKNYTASRTLLRPMAHSMANDIYRKVTGRQGVFRTRLMHISKRRDQYQLNISDWDGRRNKALNISSSVILSPRWSTDGKKIIYSAERGRQWNVYVTDFNTMQEKLAFAGPGTNIAGGFLPDSDRFLISSPRDGTPDIFVYDPSKDEMKKLVGGPGIEVSPVMSPDGSLIAYVSDRTGAPQIYMVDKFGYNMARVTYEGPYNTSPAWSPDGKSIAFTGRLDGTNQVFTIWPDGTGMKKLTSEGNNESPAYSPDGRYIAFASDRDGYKAVYMMRTDGSGQKRVTMPGMDSFSPSWSPR